MPSSEPLVNTLAVSAISPLLSDEHAGYINFENYREERSITGISGLSHPVSLGNTLLGASGDKSTDSSPANGVSLSPPRFSGRPDRSYRQKTDPSSISSVTDRWGTRQVSKVLQKSSFSIPGSGEITDPEQCGNWFKVAACSVDPKHYKKNITHSCGHIVCPTCWRDPVYKAAKTASGRIRGYIADAIAKKLHCDSYSELVLNHYVLSAPAGLIMPDMPYNQIKQKGRDMATNAGIWGGFMAFHPWRLKKRIIQQLSTLCIERANMGEEEREKRFWEMVRDDTLQLGSWREYVRWSPHFHVIGFGRLPDQNTEEEKESVKKLYKGWVVVWIRHVETFHRFTGQRLADPIADLAAYILSHTGYQENKKMPVWLGELSQNKMHVKEIIKQEYGVICPKCQADVVMGEEQMGTWIPDINSMTGKMIPRILKNRELIYVIGKNPLGRKKLLRHARIWSPPVNVTRSCGSVQHSVEFEELRAMLNTDIGGIT